MGSESLLPNGFRPQASGFGPLTARGRPGGSYLMAPLEHHVGFPQPCSPVAAEPRRWRKSMARVAGLLFATVLLLSAGARAAAPSDADRDRARESMQRGDELYQGKNYADALKMYQAADAIMNVPTTAAALARTLRKLGRLVDAREVALRAANAPQQPTDPAAFARARTDAAAMIGELDNAIPTLQVEVLGASGGVTPQIRIDDDVLAIEVANAPRRVDPGPHTVAVQLPGQPMTIEKVTAQEGDKKRVTVRVAPLAQSQSAAAAPTLAPSAPAAPATSAANTSVSPLVYVGFGVGAAGILAGTVTGALSLSKTSDVKSQCEGTTCPTSQQSEADTAKTLGWISTISFGVGLAGVGVGVVGLLMGAGGSQTDARPQVSSVHWTPAIAPGGFSVVGEF
jgi:hypothetical protein